MFDRTPLSQKKEIPDPPKHNRNEQLLIIEQLRQLNTEVSLQLAAEMEKNLPAE